MAPLIALFVGTLLARLAAWRNVGRRHFATLSGSLRVGVAAMFVLTGVAHFVGLRADLIAMVPPVLGDAGLWVTLTGVAELAGAVGILFPSTRRLAAAGLAVLLVAMFPANVYAAIHDIPFGGESPTSLVPRSIEQLVFLAAVLWAGFGERARQRDSLGKPNELGVPGHAG